MVAVIYGVILIIFMACFFLLIAESVLHGLGPVVRNLLCTFAFLLLKLLILIVTNSFKYIFRSTVWCLRCDTVSIVSLWSRDGVKNSWAALLVFA